MKALRENLRLLLLETTKQVEDASKLMQSLPNKKLYDKIQSRDDYVDTMKGIIEEKSLMFMREGGSKENANLARSVNIIASNLEHIGDHAVNLARQTGYLTDAALLQDYGIEGFFAELRQALGWVEKALNEKNMTFALKICKAEKNLDGLYSEGMKKVITELNEGKCAGDRVTVLFIMQFLERAGDSVLNIGEAILSYAVGERIKIHQFKAFQEAVGADSGNSGAISFEPVGETKSGNMIKKVNGSVLAPDSQWVIFKEGRTDKIKNEKVKTDMWESAFPGICPKIIKYTEHGKNASMIIEFLKGRTIKEIILNSSVQSIRASVSRLCCSLEEIWNATVKREQASAAYMHQAMARLDEVYKVHPGFCRNSAVIGELEVPSIEDLINRAAVIEKGIKAPFTVLIHGDFNNDNIIYDDKADRAYFIDIHRSEWTDYVQDVSVFLVSGYRMPVFDKAVRGKINSVLDYFLKFATSYALKCGDSGFESRLALGLARSFITSTRFETNPEFAGHMYMKAYYIIERFLESGDAPENFKLEKGLLAH